VYRERIAGTYRVSSYFLSKLVASFPNALVVTLLHTVLLGRSPRCAAEPPATSSSSRRIS